MESPELLEEVLASDAGSVCAIDPDGSPPGPLVRVLFTEPYLGQSEGTGPFQNSAPEAMARRIDVEGVVVPEVTILGIEGRQWIVERSERVGGPGDHWRRLVLRLVPAP